MEKIINIGIASDHAGFEMKEALKLWLQERGYQIEDFGTHSTASMDYPDVAHPLAKSIEEGRNSIGIAICGSGNGINITVNKHQSIRGALCWTPELASLARKHNDANILSLPGRFISIHDAIEIADAFLSTDFEGGRHSNRVDKIALK